MLCPKSEHASQSVTVAIRLQPFCCQSRPIQPRPSSAAPISLYAEAASFSAFCIQSYVSAAYMLESGGRTKAFMVPWRACLWLRRNFGSVPLRDGYLQVFGFLILLSDSVSTILNALFAACCFFVCCWFGSWSGLRTRYGEPSWTGCAGTSSWILSVSSVCGQQHSFDRHLLTRHCDCC